VGAAATELRGMVEPIKEMAPATGRSRKRVLLRFMFFSFWVLWAAIEGRAKVLP
jgi:hypothetical protein